jgi:CubicO group peptidase (beta-lactamase class C family)
MTRHQVLRATLSQCFLVVATTSAAAQSPAFSMATPAAAGFSADRLARLTSYLDRTVDSGQMVGGVMVIARHGRIVYEHASGWSNREAGLRMTPSTIFRIASQTKAVASVAAMMLVEDGRLALSDPVSRFIPGFGAAGVVWLADSAGMRAKRTAPVRRAVTVRDLLTHTAGLSYGGDSLVREQYVAEGLGPAAGYGWYFADKTEPICTTMERLAKLPLVAQPGERWVYGYATDALGCVVERASGKSLSDFIRERITTPLQMTDTRFCVPAADRARLAVVYARSGQRFQRAADGARGQGDYVASPCVSFSGGAGLTSTARDYAHFLSMVANAGAFGSTRLLSPASVSLMTRDHVGELYGQTGRASGLGFGLGFEIVLDPGRAARYGGPGQFGWGGAYGSHGWVDPATGIAAVFMTQMLPGNAGPIHERVKALVHAAVEK